MPSIQRFFARRRNAAAGIYGTVVATSIIAGLSEAHDLRPRQALEILLVGQVVLWIAHVYAGYLAHKVEHVGPIVDSLRAVAVDDWPMLRACLPAAAALLLWWLGVLSENASYWLALGLGLGELAALGFAYGRRLGQSVWVATATGAVDGGLGALLVVAKVLAS